MPRTKVENYPGDAGAMHGGCAPRTPRSGGVTIPGVGVVDGRTREAITYRNMVEDISTDMGGADNLSRAQLEHARRAAGLGVLAASLEAKIINGESDVDVERLVSIANAQSRILARLGLDRRTRDVTPPDPLAYAEQVGGER